MVDLIIYAIPAFVLLLVLEMLAFRYARDDHEMVGYEARDTRTSLSMGGGNVVINAVWKLVVLVAYAGLYELTPLRMPADEWWTYVAALLRRRPRLLLVPPHPPRDAGLLGEPRRPPLLRALQPLDRAAPDLDADDRAALLGAAGAARLRPLDDPACSWRSASSTSSGSTPSGSRSCRRRSSSSSTPLPPSRPPRRQRGLPRPQLRRHPDRLGPDLRHLPGRDRAARSTA